MHHARTLLAFLTVALAVAACSGTSDENPPGPAPIAPATPVPAAAPTPPATPTPTAPAGGTAQLLAAFDTTIAVPHRMRATMTNAAQGGPSSFVVEMQPPDRMRTTMQLPNGREMQIVSIGTDTWTNAMGRFIRMPGMPGIQGAQASATSRIRASLADGRVTYRLVGPQVLDGQPMTVWEGTGPMDLGASPSGPTGPTPPPGPPPGPEPRTGTGRVWIGADNRIYRIESREEREGGVEIDVRVEYDPSIQIEPPPT